MLRTSYSSANIGYAAAAAAAQNESPAEREGGLQRAIFPSFSTYNNTGSLHPMIVPEGWVKVSPAGAAAFGLAQAAIVQTILAVPADWISKM